MVLILINYILLVRNVNIVMVQRKLQASPTQTSSPNAPSSKAQACQPAAENLPVCLELLGTQAGPGEEERHRRAGEQGGNEQHRKGKRQIESKLESAVLAAKVYRSTKVQPAEGKQLHRLRACSQTRGFTLQVKPKKKLLCWVTGYSLVALEAQRALWGPAPTWREGKHTCDDECIITSPLHIHSWSHTQSRLTLVLNSVCECKRAKETWTCPWIRTWVLLVSLF